MIINKLVNLYKSKLMTQEEFAEKVGVSKTTISQIINGQTNPRVDLVERFAKELGVSVGYFFDEEKEVNKNFLENSGNINTGNNVKQRFANSDTGLNDCKKEVEHLRELLKEKNKIIELQERLAKANNK